MSTSKFPSFTGAANVTMFLILTFLSIPAFTSGNLQTEFTLINSCICPQNRQNLTFQCSTVGSGNTLWRGSAFSCSQNGDEILLLHSQFIGDRDDAEQCGNITARGLRVEDGVYVSQLTIPFSSYVIGHTVECVHDDSVEPVVIGNSTISFTTDPFPPPRSIRLAHIQHDPITELTFNWTIAKNVSDCTDVNYRTISNNCGKCPEITNLTEVICQVEDISSTVQVCLFAVKTVICGNNDSEALQSDLYINLKVPDAPNIVAYPVYSAECGKIISIWIEFMELTHFNITNKVDGSPTSYSLLYTDSNTGIICASHTILHSSCVAERCTHLFNFSSSNCSHSTPINVTVSATNVLGKGPLSSHSLALSLMNTFVNIMVDSGSSTLTCTFLNQDKSNELKTCSIMYNNSTMCDLTTIDNSPHGTHYAKNKSNIVIIGLPFLPLLHSDNEYSSCFVVTASNISHTAWIHGSFNKATGDSITYDSNLSFKILFLVTTPTLTSILLLVVSSFIISALTFIWCKRKAQVDFLKKDVMELPDDNEGFDSLRSDTTMITST